MTRTHLVLLTAATIAAFGPAGTADAGGSFAFGISNQGVSIGFGTSNWGVWGSSWDTGGIAVGFSAALAGYGEWVQVDGLGRVWRPWVAVGWQPYTHGRWVWTTLGWTWVAYEPWGWVPHHYGHWAYSTIGWVWSPGYAYHPGNVVWVSSGANVGWYPCAPSGWSHFNRGYQRGWNTGYAAGWRDARYATWVPWSRLDADNVASFAVRRDAAQQTVARAGVVALTAPPTRTEVERRVGRPVPEARIVEQKGSIDGHQVRFVRPEGQANEVMRHGAETVDRALSPAARSRAAAMSRSGEPERRTQMTITSDRSRSSGTTKREDSPSASRTRTIGSVGSPTDADRRAERSRSIGPSREVAATSTKAAASDDRRRTAREIPQRAVAVRSTVTGRPASRVRAPTDRPSPQPAEKATSAARPRTEGASKKTIDNQRSRSRSTTAPSPKERQTRGRGKK